MTLADLLKVVDRLAPPELAMQGDRIGLLAGDPEMDVAKAVSALDATPQVVDRALEIGARALLVHHPLIFTPLTSIAETSAHSKLVARIVRERLALYVLHTNWDVVSGGLNDALAEAIGVRDTEVLKDTQTSSLYKVIVYVPNDAVDAVRLAMGDAGAGLIGNYTHCSFRSEGVGSFLPLEGADPAIGSVGKLEDVKEWRLETLCDERQLEAVTEAMLEAHPYEEVAYDVIPVRQKGRRQGLGRVGELESDMTLGEFAAHVGEVLEVETVRSWGDQRRKVRRVALCGGGAGELVQEASKAGADVYVTGEVKHHEALEAGWMGLAVVDATHYATEVVGMKQFARMLGDECARELEVVFVP